MKRLLLAISLAIVAGCVVNPPPVTSPAVWDFSVSVDDGAGHLIPQAEVTFNDLHKTANDFGWAYFTVAGGCYPLRVEKAGFVSYAPADCLLLDRHRRLAVSLVRTAPPTPRLTASGQIFTQDGHPWRWKGVTAFKLQARFCAGENIEPFLQAVKGFNLLRVFFYVEWEGTGWTAPVDDCVHRFLDFTAARGLYVEETLITGAMAPDVAQQLVTHFFSTFDAHPNLLVELVNEPHLYGKPDTATLVVPPTALLWTSGDYDPAAKMHGAYGVAHTPRDNEWPRKAHDLFEYFHGGGPQTPADPPHHFPQVADEGEKPCNPDGNCGRAVASDFEAYGGVSALLGAGATFHFESGKYGQPPTPLEAECGSGLLRALDFYPADAPLGPYLHDTADEQVTGSLRTYKVGPYVVRVRPVSAPVLQPY